MSVRAEIKKSRKPKKYYLVTEDLSILIENWYNKHPQIDKHKAATILSEEFFRQLLLKVVSAAQRDVFDAGFPELQDEDVEVVGLDKGTFNDLLLKHDHFTTDGAPTPHREYWITLDNIYVRRPNADEGRLHGYALSVTRYFDSDCRETKYRGPRPGSDQPNLDDQIRASVIAYHSVNATRQQQGLGKLDLVVVDDGTFGGGTICEVIDKLSVHGEVVKAVRLGIAKNEGIAAIAGGRDVPFIGVSKLCPPVKDWVCERDFFPGVPTGGHVIAEAAGPQKWNPITIAESGQFVRAQYLSGWGESKWASMPSNTGQFRRQVLRLCYELWEGVESCLGRPILTRDLPEFPHRLLERRTEVLDRSWLEVLKGEIEKKY